MTRARRAFGPSSVNRVRSALDQRASAPDATRIAVASPRAKSPTLLGVAIHYALAIALGSTFAALALIVPGSAEVGLAGW
ncbi:MAG TPA: hypothetical protein VN108_04395 [Marmoricola sp.]|nr:hypothetical protein [Marmoricola sp.]